MSETEAVKLTQFAHGAGCGCKIAPKVLKEMLSGKVDQPLNNRLLVGNSSNDDAAVYDLQNGMGLIATTDFFMPVVDDAYDFGRIAAANAISDVYAMGGKPALALAILGWPVNKLSPALAASVIDGARATCNEAGIPLAGGHTIDSPEPMFGLAVNGFVALDKLKRNDTAKSGDLLFLTKRIGTGILTTAQKRGVLKASDHETMVQQLTRLNAVGEALGAIAQVHAMTDVTGFGLLGHLIEMCEGSGLSATISYGAVKKLPAVEECLLQNTVPDGTYRNWNSYGSQVGFNEDVDTLQAFSVLPDPQTNGGIMFSVAPEGVAAVTALLEQYGLGDFIQPIGMMTARGEKLVQVAK